MYIIIFVEYLCGVQFFNIIIINNVVVEFFVYYFELFFRIRDVKFEYQIKNQEYFYGFVQIVGLNGF